MFKQSILAAAAAMLLTGCTVMQPNALKVTHEGTTHIVRFNHAGQYKAGELVMVPIWYQAPGKSGDYFAEQAKIVQVLTLRSGLVDDELSGDEVDVLLDNILN